MRTVRIERTVSAWPEEVFDLISDHAGYRRFRDIGSSELVREGEPAPNGVGAFRRLRVGLLRFGEEFTAFEPGPK